jgi:hypothetical protein
MRLSHGPEVPIGGRTAKLLKIGTRKADERPRSLKPPAVDQRSRRQLRFWVALCTVISIALFAIALSNAIYEATSPSWLTFHVLLRKAYGVVAFALVGFTLARTTQLAGRAWGPVRIGLSVGLYSVFIEVCQRFFAGARESFAQQSLDVAAGLIGGALGALVAEGFVRAGRDGGS